MSSVAGLLRKVPPLAALARRRYERIYAAEREMDVFRGVYGSVEEAAATAPENIGQGYDRPETASLYRDRLDSVFPGDFPAIVWLQKLLPGAKRLFDFGGHVGVLHYSYAKYIDYPEDLEWQVFDVPAVVEAGRELAAERGAKQLSFTNDRTDASGCDVYLASGVLQYLEEPLYEILGELRERPRHVIANFATFTDGEGFVTLQNMATAYCPYVIHDRAALHAGMKQLGYEIVDEWKNADKSCEIPFHPERSLHYYRGACWRLAA
jgi:putative methyltransferase (TIGR04325 family)